MNLFKRILPGYSSDYLICRQSRLFTFPAVTEGRVLSQHDAVAGIGVGVNRKSTWTWTESVHAGRISILEVCLPSDDPQPQFPRICWKDGKFASFIFAFLCVVCVCDAAGFLYSDAFDFSVWLASLGAIIWAFSSYFYYCGRSYLKFVTLAYIPGSPCLW